MAHDDLKRSASSRKGTTLLRNPKPPASPSVGRQGHLAHLHHLLPLRCVEDRNSHAGGDARTRQE